MCSPNSWGVFLVLILLAPGPLAFAQSVGPADGSTPSESTTKSAAEDEVRELRREVTALQAQIQRLTQASERTQPAEAHLVPATDVAASAAGTDDASGSGGVTRADIDTLQREIDALKSN